MKKILVVIAVFVAMSSLTSCISYTSRTITPSRSSTPMPTVQKKAYIEELTISSKPAIWIRNAKQKKAGVKIGPQSESEYDNNVESSFQQGKTQHDANQASYEDFEEIAKYIVSRHPGIFTEQKEGAIPVKIKIDGKQIEIGQNIADMIFDRLLFCGIIPFGFHGKQSIEIVVETLEEVPRKGNDSCELKVARKTGICISPFVWIGASMAHIVRFDSGLGDNNDDMWENHFLTPEFADNVAFSVTKVLNK